MARKCSFTGKGVQVGNHVSHANNKVKRRFLPNLQPISLQSDALKQSIRLRLSTNAIRSVDKAGGLDRYLLNACPTVLSEDAQKLRRRIKRALVSAAA